jgi:transcriptional regulator with XRE-family HTH domain
MAKRREMVVKSKEAQAAGARIRSSRIGKGWSRRELAEATQSLSISRIGNYEQGLREVGIQEARILEKVMDVPAAYLLGVVSEEEAAILSALRLINKTRIDK